ncbi:flagellar assembly protein FliH [Brevibacillus humidisoli]|uniref:FliH/SctL family protein n=1 Tax=Brevibacillus humidisoli TaxID=2895522 RepID=UPI001E387228|nr:FliH/SctL family protein [Brevibacillus humidisoli]UFJ42126.1 flagellar assembly protein FliH [Brevibacillus humidisoli]
MTSLSRIFKASRYSASDEKVVLSVKLPPPSQTEQISERLQEKKEKIHPELEKAEEEAQAVLRDAEETAQKLLEEAAQHAEELRQQAEEEIKQWWQEKQQELQELADQVREQAHMEGLAQGREVGMAAVWAEEEQRVLEAKEVLERAHVNKEQIIAEAEPFLVALSVEIARKIIGEELQQAPEKIAEMVKDVLRRSRVHGQITLCVNHKHYQWLEEHRSQFLSLLDGQAELIVLPDYSVRDDGCVIRTPFGSVDARIDTQLEEIKEALLSIAKGSETDDDA